MQSEELVTRKNVISTINRKSVVNSHISSKEGRCDNLGRPCPLPTLSTDLIHFKVYLHKFECFWPRDSEIRELKIFGGRFWPILFSEKIF